MQSKLIAKDTNINHSFGPLPHGTENTAVTPRNIYSDLVASAQREGIILQTTQDAVIKSVQKKRVNSSGLPKTPTSYAETISPLNETFRNTIDGRL